MKELISEILSKETGLSKGEVNSLIEIPKNSELGDYAFPCFVLAKSFKKNPADIAKSIAPKIKSSNFEKVVYNGPYINFFINKNNFALALLNKILREKEKYGKSKEGKNKKVVIDMSSPNIAKPFGIGHLRSTLIGNSISKISESLGYKTIKINYLGDWGTQFGKLILSYKKFGKESELKKDPIKYMLNLYVEGNKEEYEDEARLWSKKLEDGDKEALALWKKFRDYSLKEFNKIYSLLGIKFDVISGESFYYKKSPEIVEILEKKNLLEESEQAMIVDLDKYGLGKCLIKRFDGATLYATRDLAAAIDRYKKYSFDRLIYEVGQEQTLHFNQVFKVLDLLGYNWANKCTHVAHGFYLSNDGKKFATRQGKTIFMEEVIQETIDLAKKEITKREKLSKSELEKRAKSIALAAILYGDLKNYRLNDLVFDIDKFLSFEGNTGPYLLYSYARARSILRKVKRKKARRINAPLTEKENELIKALGNYPNIIQKAYDDLAPNLIANYAYDLSQKFNEFYHSSQVINSENESLRLALVESFSIVLKGSLALLGISVLEKM